VVNQTFEDWQCVISDDASTDRSVEIAKEYQAKDPRFKVITHSKNVGAANNWNRAKDNNVSFATKILCADDYLHPEALSKQFNVLKETGTAIVFSEREIIFPGGKKLNPKLPIYSKNIYYKDAFKYYIKAGRNIFGEPVAALFKTDVFVESEGFQKEFEYSLDTSGYLAVSRGQEVTFDSSTVGVFRVSKDQWSHRLKGDQYSHVFEFINHLVTKEGIRVTSTELFLGKLKVMVANLIRIVLYSLMRDK
jgi:glycosyltransferase involved in cell wall biosynthesis